MGGTVLGLAYFSGLRYTVGRLVASPRPYRLLAASFTIRAALAVGAFYFIMGGEWERLASAMTGFLLVRFVLIRKWGSVESSGREGGPLWKS